MTTLLVAGATGLVGSLALTLALADERVNHVIALTRHPIPPRPKQRNVVIDFADIPADADWWNVDGVISALGTTRASTPSPSAYRAIDLGYPLVLARYARAHGAARFALVSSLGADPRSCFAYTRTKGELETELKALGFPSLTIVRPSVLNGRRDDVRFDERLTLTLLRVLTPVLPRRLGPSPAVAVAAMLLEGAVSASIGMHLKTNADMHLFDALTYSQNTIACRNAVAG